MGVPKVYKVYNRTDPEIESDSFEKEG